MTTIDPEAARAYSGDKTEIHAWYCPGNKGRCGNKVARLWSTDAGLIFTTNLPQPDPVDFKKALSVGLRKGVVGGPSVLQFTRSMRAVDSLEAVCLDHGIVAIHHAPRFSLYVVDQ